ncbi:hypothetical protein BDV59DRAFT_202557 [Aspergillus ambiguus]|uniref:uncharacterized protein n=1 Tax=Aspergillus ambiguus TaxID=176160 RepID=UPI003CCCE2D9
MKVSPTLLLPVFFGSLGASAMGPQSWGPKQLNVKGRMCGGTNRYDVNLQSRTFFMAQWGEFAGDKKPTDTDNQQFPTEYVRNPPVTFSACNGLTTPLRQFPIMPDGTYFQGHNEVDAGTDRIVYTYARINQFGLAEDFTYCGIVTHLGGPDDGFVECPEI